MIMILNKKIYKKIIKSQWVNLITVKINNRQFFLKNKSNGKLWMNLII